MSIEFLNLQNVLAVHRRALDVDGGTPGTKDIGLIESAIHAPLDRYQYQFDQRPSDLAISVLAATYWFHLVLNHGFVDGNKRVGLGCMDLFLQINGFQLQSTSAEVEKVTMLIASGEMKREEVEAFVWHSLGRR